jgi:uncharacterized BrkB/YihY/UPF0761 family membrane protein
MLTVKQYVVGYVIILIILIILYLFAVPVDKKQTLLYVIIIVFVVGLLGAIGLQYYIESYAGPTSADYGENYK